jgi:transposase
MPPWRRRNSVTVVGNTSPVSSDVIRRPSNKAAATWPNCRRTRLKVASEKRGGRKKASIDQPELEENLRQIVRDHTAGDPMQAKAVWTYLSPPEIAQRLETRGTPVCADTVRDLLDELGFVQRKAQKRLAMGATPFRNEQFENIARLKAEYLASDNPILSMDTKKKEHLGNFYRDGKLYTTGVIETLDHDFSSAADGLIIPHGLFDFKRNLGHITLGFSHDTSQFACDSLYLWWQRYGQSTYPKSKSILLLCDGGGSNNARHHIFKEDLLRLVNRIQVPIRVAHYPPYCSKYNPIEHRLFPHITRALSGVILKTVELVKALIRRTHTQTGLKVTVGILKKFYETKREATDRFLEAFPIHFDDFLPDWNYVVRPTVY